MSKLQKLGKILYRLLFTRDDDLDLLQIFFLVIIVYFIVAFSLVGAGIWSVTNAAWTTFISVFVTLSIAGTPKWIAILLANRNKNNQPSFRVTEVTGVPEEYDAPDASDAEPPEDNEEDGTKPEIG